MTKKPNLCPACSQNLVSKLIPYKNKGYPNYAQLEGLQISVCSNCELGIAIPERSWDVMEAFYKTSYRGVGSIHESSGSTIMDKYSINTRSLSQWMLLKTFKNFVERDLFCDIGPGGCPTFQTTRFLGYNMKMFAYEPDVKVKDELKKFGVHVFQKSFSPATKLPPERFDVVIMSHLLEHFCGGDSIKVLRKVKDMLMDDGLFLCEVPNIPDEYYTHRLDDSPYLTFWTTTSLRLPLESAGLIPIFMSTTNITFSDWVKRLNQTPNYMKRKVKELLPNMVIKAIKQLRLITRSTKNIAAYYLSIYSPDIIFNLYKRLQFMILNKTAYDYLSNDNFSYGKKG